jgi:ATP-dependent DNA helicase RecG
MLSQEELETLFQNLESDRVERKRSSSDRSGIRRSICAFANDLPGHGKPGLIFVGVNDDGSCANMTIKDEDIRLLAQMRSDGNIQPLPSFSVQREIIAGCEVIVITVELSSQPPVRYEGRVWVRVGSTNQLASPEEERRLSERRRAYDLPFDHRPVTEANIADLNLGYFRDEYLPQAIAPEILEQNARSIEHQLLALRFTTQGFPNHGALICLGKDPLRWSPGAYIQFLRIDGTQLTDPINDQKQLAGPLYQVLAELDDLLKINVAVRTDVKSGPKEIRKPDYSVAALQQLARNALMHRSYEGTNAPVKIYWFSDRIEISNPGGLYGHVNKENFGTGATDYRNPLIAEFMGTLGYVQKFGLGIPLARDELAKNGNPAPEFAFESGNVLVTVRSA